MIPSAVLQPLTTSGTPSDAPTSDLLNAEQRPRVWCKTLSMENSRICKFAPRGTSLFSLTPSCLRSKRIGHHIAAS